MANKQNIIEFPYGDAIEEERIEGDVVFVGEALVDAVELGRVVGAHVGRRHHAGEKRGLVAGLKLGEDLVEIALGDLRRDAAQRVVGAQFDDDEIGLLRHRPFQPRQATAGGVARHARIGDAGVVAGIAQGRLQLLGEGFARADTIAGAQTVAECDDLQRFARLGGRRRLLRQCRGRQHQP